MPLFARPAASDLGFPSTQSLLDALPHTHAHFIKANVSPTGKAIRARKDRPRWAPGHGGDQALLVRKSLDERPDVAARAV